MIVTSAACIPYLRVLRCVHLICVWFTEREGWMEGESEVEVMVKPRHIHIQTLFLHALHRMKVGDV